jgi:hypothetical protein
MSKFYMWLYDIFNSIANYFWEKSSSSKEKIMEDLKETFGKEFIDCILGKCKDNCVYCLNEKEQLCQKEKELTEQKLVDLRK